MTQIYARCCTKAMICVGIFFSFFMNPAPARWEEQASDLPAWAQRGRIILLHGGGATLPELAQWQPVFHHHGARLSDMAIVAECKAKRIPMSLRAEAMMFFGDDRAVKKIPESVTETSPHGLP